MRSDGYRVAVGGGLEPLRIVLRSHPPGLHVRLQRAFLQLDVTKPLNRLHRCGLPLQREAHCLFGELFLLRRQDFVALDEAGVERVRQQRSNVILLLLLAAATNRWWLSAD